MAVNFAQFVALASHSKFSLQKSNKCLSEVYVATKILFTLQDFFESSGCNSLLVRSLEVGWGVHTTWLVDDGSIHTKRLSFIKHGWLLYLVSKQHFVSIAHARSDTGITEKQCVHRLMYFHYKDEKQNESRLWSFCWGCSDHLLISCPPMSLLTGCIWFYVILARLDIKPNAYPVLSVTQRGSHLTIKSSQSGYEQKPVGNPTTGLKSCGVNSASDASMSLNREQRMFNKKCFADNQNLADSLEDYYWSFPCEIIKETSSSFKHRFSFCKITWEIGHLWFLCA